MQIPSGRVLRKSFKSSDSAFGQYNKRFLNEHDDFKSQSPNNSTNIVIDDNDLLRKRNENFILYEDELKSTKKLKGVKKRPWKFLGLKIKG